MWKMNKGPFDIWSIAHFVVGLLFVAFVPIDIVVFTFVIVGWEVAEVYLKKLGGLFYSFVPRNLVTLDTPINKMSDILFGLAGWLIGHYVLYGTWYK